MLHWKVCYVKDNCPYEVVRRKRKHRQGHVGVILICAALLVLFLVLPAWVIAVIVCAVLISLGLLWLLT
ncbi:MAG: hypothetical protein LBS18_05825 [Clostridiales bacterium]|jgi:hypothetical protein|nr:hypothetical protein [Clostridiales bacterium]